MANHEQDEQDCRDTGAPPDECVVPEPTLVEFTGSPTPFKDATGTALKLSALLVALVAFMIAASFIGAEYSSGSITSWLTFVPRRGHVFWSKLLTVAGFAVARHALRHAGIRCGSRTGPPTRVSRRVGQGISRDGSTQRPARRRTGHLRFLYRSALPPHRRRDWRPIALVVVWFVRIGPLGSLAWAQRSTPWTPDGNISAIVDHGYTYSVPVERRHQME